MILFVAITSITQNTVRNVASRRLHAASLYPWREGAAFGTHFLVLDRLLGHNCDRGPTTNSQNPGVVRGKSP